MAFQSEDRGFPDQAIEWYKKAISMDSSFTDAYSALGALYNKVDRPIDAILILQKSLRISPQSYQNYRLYKNLAESHFYLQEYEKAFNYLEKSKSLKPDFPETEKCFARLYEATGNIDQSIQHWQNFIELETDTAEIKAAQNHLLTIQR
jgi:tetratricopeptide (TPR) repeat protein